MGMRTKLGGDLMLRDMQGWESIVYASVLSQGCLIAGNRQSSVSISRNADWRLVPDKFHRKIWTSSGQRAICSIGSVTRLFSTSLSFCQ